MGKGWKAHVKASFRAEVQDPLHGGCCLAWEVTFQQELPHRLYDIHMGVSENREPYYSTLHSRILIIKTPKQGIPNFRKLPYLSIESTEAR